MALSLDPDLILLDLTLPDLNGYEVCSRLGADLRTKDIPVLLLAGRDEAEDGHRGLDCGAADYLPRPFRPAVARMRVRNLQCFFTPPRTALPAPPPGRGRA